MANLTDRQLKDTFDLFDADASGAIDVDDVGLLMEALGFGKLPAEEIEDIVRQTDRDESRVIEFDDYRRMVRSKAAHDNSPEEMRLAFNYFDHGSKGAVTVHDFCKVAERLAEEPRPDLYNEIIREAAGADAEGINYENWSSLHREVNADKHHYYSFSYDA
eukprot:TRINITY_DN2095_c0_g1_i1.p2 TRINITY_DN2095_c0_g1~~TRINITY_DN2095_c0_g1_i1.p2  ORF type:complete len:161 (+),score=88.53 TRINITY_DN2095_c0_g1_i1:76-558(+)